MLDTETRLFTKPLYHICNIPLLPCLPAFTALSTHRSNSLFLDILLFFKINASQILFLILFFDSAWLLVHNFHSTCFEAFLTSFLKNLSYLRLHSMQLSFAPSAFGKILKYLSHSTQIPSASGIQPVCRTVSHVLLRCSESSNSFESFVKTLLFEFAFIDLLAVTTHILKVQCFGSKVACILYCRHLGSCCICI